MLDMTCHVEHGEQRVRVLDGRHASGCTRDDCSGCLPCPEQHCLSCARQHVADPGSLTCPSCLAVARMNLASIVTLAGRLHVEARYGRAARKVYDGVPGGDALVLLAPGASTTGTLGQLAHRLAFDLDVSHTRDESRADPRPPLQVLATWEAAERARNGSVSDEQPTLGSLVRFLGERLPVMAREAGFVGFGRDLAACVRQLENVVHAGERPETSRVPCWECGTRLVKQYADQERDDFWQCPHCRERYDRGRYDRAKHDHLASEGAERFVLVADGARVIGRSEKTVRTWIQRGQVRSEKHAVSGRRVVWWPDIRDRRKGDT